MVERIGERVGSYLLEELIAEGGMGRVFRATHLTLGRETAVKILQPAEMNDPAAHQRFLEEGRKASASRHPNIVEIYDSGISDEGSAYIAMEFLPGTPLSSRLDQGPIAIKDTLEWTIQTARALSHAHRQGVVHRDIKPANIFLVPDVSNHTGFRVKVLDFGLAKWRRIALDQTLCTRSGILLGTPLYMSPEQCLGSRDIDARSDVYSLGVMLYEMVTGTRPFENTWPPALLQMHVYETPLPPSYHRPDLSPAMEEIILMALSKDMCHRQSSMDELGDQLSRLAGDLREAVPLVGMDFSDDFCCGRYRTYDRAELLEFLHEIDRRLDSPAYLEVSGAAAATLVYGGEGRTRAIDTYSPIERRILEAAKRTSLRIPLARGKLASLIDWYDDRKFQLPVPFDNLAVWIPERHDLLLLLALRGLADDFRTIQAMHTARPFDLDILVERYNHEMWRNSGPFPVVERKVEAAIEQVFGRNRVRRNVRFIAP